MDPEDLFLHKREDLLRRIDPTTMPPSLPDAEYRVLMASPLLRELLLSSLVDRVNRPHRVKITYRCVPLTPMKDLGLPVPDLHLAAAGFALVDQVNPQFVQTLAVEQFLKATVGTVGEHVLTVYDLVEYAANAAGGTHYDPTPKADKPKRTVVDDLNNYVRLNGFQAALHALMSIGEVVVVGLEPLAQAIKAERGR